MTLCDFFQLVLCGALVNVVPLLYDYSGMTLEALLCLAERTMKGRAIQSIGIIAEGNSEEIRLIEGAIRLVQMDNGVIMCSMLCKSRIQFW